MVFMAWWSVGVLNSSVWWAYSGEMQGLRLRGLPSAGAGMACCTAFSTAWRAMPLMLSFSPASASATAAALTFVGDGRGNLPMGLLLGGTAALASQWSASRLQKVSEDRLVWLLRALTALLALDGARRAIQLATAVS